MRFITSEKWGTSPPKGMQILFFNYGDILLFIDHLVKLIVFNCNAKRWA